MLPLAHGDLGRRVLSFCAPMTSEAAAADQTEAL
jgi:hypothetical protein